MNDLDYLCGALNGVSSMCYTVPVVGYGLSFEIAKHKKNTKIGEKAACGLSMTIVRVRSDPFAWC